MLNTLNFMKSKWRNKLTIHLDLVIQMFPQIFILFRIFLKAYRDVAIQEWKAMFVQYVFDA